MHRLVRAPFLPLPTLLPCSVEMEAQIVKANPSLIGEEEHIELIGR
jgi:hypothetical protein